ncbi:MAG: choice-of-anchor D domain-containing protein, partial [Calditrichaeota bacterium]|nr:choice-of-anchor D domain-containing protein [Calditrichota bacterium]
MDGAWFNGAVYAGQHGQQNIRRYDINGNALQEVPAVGFTFYGIAIDQENQWLFLRDAAAPTPIRVFQLLDNGMRGNLIGQITNYLQYLGNQVPYNLEWVWRHPDGQLWISQQSTQQLVQIQVNTENWQCVREVVRFANGGANQLYDACAHDGHNILQAGQALGNVRVYDDGVTEMYWLLWDPQEGTIESGADTDMIVTLNATGLIGGDYEADLHILTNDPANVDVVVNIRLHVSGRPVIEVEWAAAHGFPNIVDWNRAHPDLFTGGPYPVPITIINAGTDDLTVESITCENNDFFSANPANFVLPAEQRRVVQFILNAQEDGLHEGTMTIVSDGSDEDIQIALRGRTSAPPEIVIDPGEVVDELVIGQTAEHTVNVANQGDALLRWDTDLEEIREPGDDANGRALRSVNGGPRRDQPEGRGILIANVCGWSNWDFEQYFRGVQGLQYSRYRQWNEVANVDFNDYDFMWIGNYEAEAWVADYNRNLARIEEFVDNGGALYRCVGTNNHGTRAIIPGGITYTWGVIGGDQSQNQCPLQVNPEDNFLIDWMNRNDAHGGRGWWRRGAQLVGSGCAHGVFQPNDIQRLDNVDQDEIQIIALGNPVAMPIIFLYPYGRGWVLASTTVDGFLHNNPASYHWGRTGIGMIWYLDYLAALTRWVDWDPKEGEIDPGGDTDVIITFNTEGCIGGEYEADLHFLSNDPANRDVAVNLLLTVIGAPAVVTDPLAHPMPNAPANLGFPNTYVEGASQIVVTLQNTGTDELVIESSEIENPDDFGTTLRDNTVVAPGDRIQFALVFHPSAIGRREGVINFYSNARNIGEGEEVGHFWFDVFGVGMTPPQIATSVENDGWIRVNMQLDDDPLDRPFIIRNVADEGGADLVWNISLEEVEQQFDANHRSLRSVNSGGPRRDPIESRFALFQQVNPWGGNIEELVFRRVQGLNYTRYSADANFANFPIGDFDCIWISHNEHGDAWNTAYNNARARFEQWVDDGGVYYASTGTNNYNVAPVHPGDLRYRQGYCSNGTVVISANPNDAAYNYLAQLMNWRVGTVLSGDYLVHTYYHPNDIRNLQNSDWNQTIFVRADEGGGDDERDVNEPGALVYNYGDGYCIASGTTDGYMHVNHNQPPNWGAAGPSIIAYMDYLANLGVSWLTVAPEAGVTARGEESEVTLTFDAADLEMDNDYLADLIITNNDPLNPIVVIRLTFTIGEEPVQPPPWEFVETNANHSLLVTGVAFDNEPAPSGWAVGVFTPAGLCCGAMWWLDDGQQHGLPAWGDDPETQAIDGFRNGELMRFLLGDPEADVEWNARTNIAEGPAVWTANSLTVLSLGGFSAKDLEVAFNINWNLISINVVPLQELWTRQEGPDVVRMTEQLREQPDNLQSRHNILLMKDERGRFYSPANRFNNIPFWNLAEGYQIKMAQAMRTTWSGAPIPPDADVPITIGWNMIAYFPDYPLAATAQSGFYVISPIRNAVVIAKDARGAFMVPRLGFSNMVTWVETQGYQIKVDQAVTLNYPAARGGFAMALPMEENTTGYWIEPGITGSNMSVLITGISGLDVSNGGQVAAFNTAGRLVGVGSITDGQAGLAVWGDDPSTEAVDGLLPGEA